MIHIVLLSGGSGVRLWPLSNSARAKQFLKVLRDDHGNHVSMVQRVYGQIRRVDADLDVTVATNSKQASAITMQLGNGVSLVLEPSRRDTAPAIMLACAQLDLVGGFSSEDPVIVMPIDSYAEQRYYDQIPHIATAVKRGSSDLVLMGIEPDYPSEKYGYVIPGLRRPDGLLEVTSFKEKPDECMARKYIEEGGLWNGGVFGFRLGWLRDLTREYLDTETFADFVERYDDLPKNSFDFEVVERTKSICVIPFAGMWKDLGTWNTLSEEMRDATSGPVWVDEETVSNVHAINETSFPLVIAGLSDSVVVATSDGLLVSGKEESSRIKPLVEQASSNRPMYERRWWGRYRVLDAGNYADGSHALTKELIISPGSQISYQVHRHRSENWTVVGGTGEVVIDDIVSQVGVGNSVSVAPGQRHAVRATSELHIIEVQVGWPLVEEDIERFGFYWAKDDEANA